MINKTRTVALAAAAALVMLPVFSVNLLSWDQFLPYVYNSHTVITTDAALAANRTLRASRAAELSGWTRGLYSRLLPRIPYDWAPMGVSELSGGFYPELHLDDGGYYTMNRLGEGNSVADKPRMFSKWHSAALFNAYCGFFTDKLRWAKDAEGCKELPLTGPTPLHFNREYTEETPANRTPAGGRVPPQGRCRHKGADPRGLVLLEKRTGGNRQGRGDAGI